MYRQHFTRRIVLSAAVVGLAILTALGGGDGVNAEENAHDFGSKAEFKSACESNVIEGVSGTFVDSPKDNLTACFYGDGSKNVCDQNGNDCNYYPPPKSNQEPGSGGPFLGSNGEIITETPPVEPMPTVEETLIGGGAVLADIHVIADETQTVAPVDAPLQAVAETDVAAAAEAPVTLTEESVAAEEPMAGEASAEQP